MRERVFTGELNVLTEKIIEHSRNNPIPEQNDEVFTEISEKPSPQELLKESKEYLEKGAQPRDAFIFEY